VPGGQPANGCRERHDPQLQILHDLAAVRVDEVRVDRRHAALVEAEAEPRIEVIAKPDQPFAAECRRRESAESIIQKIQIAHQHIVAQAVGGRPARIEAGGHEPAKIQIERLLSRGNRGRDEAHDRADHGHTRYRNKPSTHCISSRGTCVASAWPDT
jgi:hypothetical protein